MPCGNLSSLLRSAAGSCAAEAYHTQLPSLKSYLARQLGMAMTTVQRYYDEVRAELRGEESPVPQT